MKKMSAVINVANNIKMIEQLKADLLYNCAGLFGDVLKDPGQKMDSNIADDASNIIILSYLISKRMGIDYGMINEKIVHKLKTGIESGDSIERNFGDLSKLLSNMEKLV